jgi:ABC-type glycerol-3-phosphate transport system substrate-binding protein
MERLEQTMQTTQAVSVVVAATTLIGLAGCASGSQNSQTEQVSSQPSASPTASPTDSPTPGPVDLRWFSFYGGAAQGVWDIHVRDAFERTHANVMVTYGGAGLYGAPVPADALDRQLTLERPPDVVTGFIGGASLERYVHAGAISDLSDLWESEDLADAYPQSISELAKVDGRPYFVPLTVQWNPIFYRKDIFDELGLEPPDSWDSLLQTCRTLNEAGIVPFTNSAAVWTPPNARWFSILDLRLNGASFHQRLLAGEVSFQDPRVKDVFEHWLAMLDADCFNPPDQPGSWFQAVDQISNGEAAMFNIGEWLYEFISPDVQENIDFFRFPILDPNIDNGEIALVYGAYIPQDALHPDDGRAFIRYLLSQDGLQSSLDEVSRLIPMNRMPEDLFPEHQRKGLAFLEETPHLSELFEFNAFEGSMAEHGLADLAAFWKARDEAAIDEAMAQLEAARQDALAAEAN